MQQLRKKLKTKSNNIPAGQHGSVGAYNRGYLEALLNVINDIDSQMMAIEKEQIQKAFINGQSRELTKLTHDKYYTLTYEK